MRRRCVSADRLASPRRLSRRLFRQSSLEADVSPSPATKDQLVLTSRPASQRKHRKRSLMPGGITWMSKHDARRKESEVNGCVCAVFVRTCVFALSLPLMPTATRAQSLFEDVQPAAIFRHLSEMTDSHVSITTTDGRFSPRNTTRQVGRRGLALRESWRRCDSC